MLPWFGNWILAGLFFSTAPPVTFPAGDAATPPLPVSVVVQEDRTPVYLRPESGSPRRGILSEGYRLPAFRMAQGRGCATWWVQVHADAWICGTRLSTSPLPPDAPDLPVLAGDDLLPFPCAFIREEGAPMYRRLSDYLVDLPERWLEKGYSISVRRRLSFEGERFYETAGGMYVQASTAFMARPSTFQGQELAGREDLGWTYRDSTRIHEALPGEPAASSSVVGRQTLLRFVGESEARGVTYLLLDTGGYVRASEVRRVRYTDPPANVGPYDRWFDVDRERQVLVAYEGSTPLFATLVSSGRRGHATPSGEYRIWVKLLTGRMANEEPEDPEEDPYYLEDVPWVMYFNDDIALHAAYWHKGFGVVRSHGCVNLSPIDARRVFGLARPSLPGGWWSVFPTEQDPGSVVRVR